VLQHRFDVGEPPSGVSVIIDRDLQRELEIALSVLRLPNASQEVGSAGDETPSLFEIDDGPPHHLVNAPELQAALRRNQARNSFCNLPEAVVELDTGDHAPDYRRQYPIVHAIQPIVDEQVNEWVDSGKVIDARCGSVSGTPLLVALKKDHAKGEKKPGRANQCWPTVSCHECQEQSFEAAA
jgi:hypothetical protein